MVQATVARVSQAKPLRTTCDPVRTELAGARDEQHLNDLRRLLARASVVPTGPDDYENAAVLYRTCRQSGATVRKLINCLIATVAIRPEVPILHADADFDALARYTPFQIDPL
jgi:hypothetical protein